MQFLFLLRFCSSCFVTCALVPMEQIQRFALKGNNYCAAHNNFRIVQNSYECWTVIEFHKFLICVMQDSNRNFVKLYKCRNTLTCCLVLTFVSSMYGGLASVGLLGISNPLLPVNSVTQHSYEECIRIDIFHRSKRRSGRNFFFRRFD